MTNMEEYISLATDFVMWLLFILTLISTAVLLVTGTVTLLMGSGWGSFLYFLGATVSLGIHFLINRI